MFHQLTLAAVVPAFNEAPSIATVVGKLRLLQFQGQPLVDRIVVGNNGSTDATAELAAAAGAQVVSEPSKGYGAACLAAMKLTEGYDLVVFIDGDDSCLPSELLSLLERWQQGADLVIGSRALGHVQRGALPPHQRWGNWLAGTLLTWGWQQPVTDLGPFRLISTLRLAQLDMQELTFGWTVEMQIKALILGLEVAEVPVTSKPRLGLSKVSGTLRGSIGASWGILSTIARYWWLAKTNLWPAANQPPLVQALDHPLDHEKQRR